MKPVPYMCETSHLYVKQIVRTNILSLRPYLPSHSSSLRSALQYGEEYEEEEEYDEEGEEGEDGEEWAISAQREQHMRSALMIQKAACLDMIGQGAYDQL